MWVQAGLAIALFLGSLGTLFYNAYTATSFPQQELKVRGSLQQASRLMADSAASALQSPPHDSDQLEKMHHTLSAVTKLVLTKFIGVEGGFYLENGDRFIGYGFPTADARHPIELHRTDPPPLEAPLIRLQAQQSLLEHTPLFTVRDVGPSRVMVVTEGIGEDRPARAATWAMVRLTGPEQLEGRLRRYQVSIGLALAGFSLALVLTFSLTRSLRAQKAAQAKLLDELRRSEQLAALGKLLAGVAHEIRNPLAGIRSTIQLWQRKPAHVLDTGSMEAIVNATARLNDILTRLLHFARTEHAERKPVQVNDLMAETCKLLDAQAHGQGVSVDCNLEQGLPNVLASATALRQLLLNLMTNALQAMPNGGRLVCRTRHQRQAQAVEITVTDTGPGVSSDDRKHLFEPFFTTRTEGTGLGLALCREIVLQHGGIIELVSPSDIGATFRVLLPTAER